MLRNRVLLRSFSSLKNSVQVENKPDFQSQLDSQNLQIQNMRFCINELETKFKDKLESNFLEKPLFKFQKKSKDDSDYKYDMDLTIDRGQFITGFVIIMIFYGIFVK